jgi:hypothetical protein
MKILLAARSRPSFVQRRSPDGAKRNPGTIEELERRSRISLRSIRATKFRATKKGSGTPADAWSPCPHQADAARVQRDALACRRSTAALAKGALAPFAQLQARLPGTRRDAASCKRAPTGGRRRCASNTGVTRARLSQSRESTSRTGRNTGAHDARSRSGADCEAARKHRTRSTLRIASERVLR